MNNKFLKWIPAFVMMIVIFWFSSQPITELPNFSWADTLIKKLGHMIGYAMLAVCYWYGLARKHDQWWVAWMLAILYALTDEYHQRFVFGRHSTIWDVLIFDNLGALIGLWLANRYWQRKRSDATT